MLYCQSMVLNNNQNHSRYSVSGLSDPGLVSGVSIILYLYYMEDFKMISKEKKQAIIAEYARTPDDTGSPEVQVAVLTARIQE